MVATVNPRKRKQFPLGLLEFFCRPLHLCFCAPLSSLGCFLIASRCPRPTFSSSQFSVLVFVCTRTFFRIPDGFLKIPITGSHYLRLWLSSSSLEFSFFYCLANKVYLFPIFYEGFCILAVMGCRRLPPNFGPPRFITFYASAHGTSCEGTRIQNSVPTSFCQFPLTPATSYRQSFNFQPIPANSHPFLVVLASSRHEFLPILIGCHREFPLVLAIPDSSRKLLRVPDNFRHEFPLPASSRLFSLVPATSSRQFPLASSQAHTKSDSALNGFPRKQTVNLQQKHYFGAKCTLYWKPRKEDAENVKALKRAKALGFVFMFKTATIDDVSFCM